jgi:UDP-N-acetylmuramoyl-tripeptide--D-alanyl-D-alanine ligase
MLELGAGSEAEHRLVGEQAASLGIDRLLAVGAAEPAAEGFVAAGGRPDAAQVVPDVATAQTLLTDLLRPGDVVLLKSSRDSGLRHLGDTLAHAMPPT